MKRIAGLMVLVLLLCACVPTPEQEFVVNKSENAVEQKLSASPKPEQKAAMLFPDHWKEDPYQPYDRFTIEIDAEIVQKADGIYPVYRTRGRDFTDADASDFAEKVLDKPVSVRESMMTKADWTREFQSWLEEVEAHRAWIAAGKPDDGIDRDESEISQKEIDEESEWYREQIRNAPDDLPETPVSDYRLLGLGESKVFTLENGRTAYVSADYWSIRICLDCASQGYLYTESRIEQDQKWGEPGAEVWREPSMTEEEAAAMLQSALEKLGMTDFTVRLSQKGNLYQELGGKPVSSAAGWAFSLVRDYGGYPTSRVPFEPHQNLAYGEDDGFAANKPIEKETLEILIGPEGLQMIEYNCPKTVAGVENPDVELLPWEKVKTRIQSAFKLTAPVKWAEEQDTVHTYRVYRLLLTTWTVRAKDSQDYYEMPCWVVFFDRDIRSRGHEAEYEQWYGSDYWERNRNNTDLMQETLIINAVDGSIVFNDYGAR